MLSACADSPGAEATAEDHAATLMEIERSARAERVAKVQASQADYLGVETRLLDGDLVSFLVSMQNVSAEEDLAAYAECAAAQYAMIRGYGFARHVRTTTKERSGTWTADAI